MSKIDRFFFFFGFFFFFCFLVATTVAHAQLPNTQLTFRGDATKISLGVSAEIEIQIDPAPHNPRQFSLALEGGTNAANVVLSSTSVVLGPFDPKKSITLTYQGPGTSSLVAKAVDGSGLSATIPVVTSAPGILAKKKKKIIIIIFIPFFLFFFFWLCRIEFLACSGRR